MSSNLSRREFLKLLGVGTATVAAGGLLAKRLLSPPASPLAPGGSVATSAAELPPGNPDVEIALRAVQDELPILPGQRTRVWRFRAEVLRGPKNAVQELPERYVGPIFRLKKGQRVRIRFSHDLPEVSIVHWHGLHVAEVNDGHPRYVIPAGKEYIYDFVVRDRAGTYWFHPHPHGRTGPQVYHGLAGLFLVSDDEEQALGLPGGAYDIPLVLQDRRFDGNNQLAYLNRPMDRMMGFLGDTILVNGEVDFTLPVATRPYRLRLLNGSNSRIYKLAWEDGTPLTVIGTDGGLLERPLAKAFVTLAPAQRVELWVDFGKYPVGATLKMLSLSHAAPGGSKPFPVFTAKVARKEKSTARLPQRLSTIIPHHRQDAVNAASSRTFTLAMSMGRGWTINSRTFEMTAVAPDEVVRLGDTEVWSFINQANGGMGRGMGGGMMMSLPHPMHVHDLQYTILQRHIDPQWRAAWNTLAPGFVDQGWHDTVLVMPGERVDIALQFRDFKGLFPYHCHNLEHEDMGMMRNYRVQKG